MVSSNKKLSTKVKKALDGTALIILLIFVTILASNVISLYASKRSSMTNMEQPIEEYPTVTICFRDPKSGNGSSWNEKMFELETEVNITYYHNQA